MKCLRCNGEIKETAKFCEHCGNVINSEDINKEVEQIETVVDLEKEDNEVDGEVKCEIATGDIPIEGIYREGYENRNKTNGSDITTNRNNSRPRQQYNQIVTNSNALIGFILSLISVPITLFGIVPIISLIFSIKGISEIGRTGENGKGLAVAGIVISSLCLIVVAVILFIAVVGSMMI